MSYYSDLERAFPLDGLPLLTAFLEETRKAAGRDVKLRRKGLTSWAIEEPVGQHYTKERATVRIKRGKVSCWGAAEPDDKRAAEIVAEVEAANWPEPTPGGVNSTDGLRPVIRGLNRKGRSTLYECRTANGKGILGVQERVDPPGDDFDARKSYHFWTYFSDGRWYEHEPDELPLCGLDRLSDQASYPFPVMIHEGAKTAEEITENLKAGWQFWDHPQAEYLSRFVHLGWLGGAARPGAPDWTPIRQLSATRPVVILADNDKVGKDAVSEIAKRLAGRSLKAIFFDDRFPAGFDLADAWPDAKKRPSWYDKDGRYTGDGPTLEDMTRPATWATRKLPSEGRGRPPHEILPEFAAEWVWSVDPPVFVHRDQPDRILKEDDFNRLVRPFSDLKDTAGLLNKEASSMADGIAYRPRPGCARAEVITIDGRRVVNTYRPPRIEAAKLKPDVIATAAAKPFLDYMSHLIPDPGDLHQTLRWVATLIARPEVRMRYSLLLISATQGVGKSTLGEILAQLVGPWNASFPSEKSIVDSSFNRWLVHKRLVVVNEIYAGESHKAYDKLKTYITDKTAEANKKYLGEYDIELWCVILACSNSEKALYLDEEDRRWLVPKVTNEKRLKPYWDSFYDWLEREGGYSMIRAWADDFLRDPDNVVGTGEHAPMTAQKAAIIREGRSAGKQIVRDLVEMIDRIGGRVVLRADELRNYVASKRNLDAKSEQLEKMVTLRREAVRAGMKEPPPAPGREDRDQRVPIGGVPTYVLANFDIEAGATWDSLKEFYKMPSTIEREAALALADDHIEA